MSGYYLYGGSWNNIVHNCTVVSWKGAWLNYGFFDRSFRVVKLTKI